MTQTITREDNAVLQSNTIEYTAHKTFWKFVVLKSQHPQTQTEKQAGEERKIEK